MQRVYLDNAATTPMAPEVIAEMMRVMSTCFGNPSSVHGYGREAKAEIERSRRTVARLLNCQPGEIVFTSGGTEADNMALVCSVRDLGVRRIITSGIEHHAVTHTVKSVAHQGVTIAEVNLLADGHVDMAHLATMLEDRTYGPTLVSLMHANNEIGNLTDIAAVARLCRSHGAYFHSDTVQTMGHYRMDLTSLGIHFVTCSAHKFHGPKGIGFLYMSSDVRISPILQGGAQERNMRGGTENIYGIVGLAKALDMCHHDMEGHQQHVQGLKDHMMARLRQELPGVGFNGDADGRSLYTVLNVDLPATPIAEMMLFNLDIMGVAASGGSACSSGSQKGSHVLAHLPRDHSRPAVRFSFSRYTTKAEVDHAIDCVVKLYAKAPATA